MSEEAPEVRELTLTKLGSKAVEARLTLTDDRLTIETPEDSPLPAWLQGEIPFDELDVAYIDPAKERAEADEADEEESEPAVLPGFRLSRWIEISNEPTGEVFDRRGAFLCDEGHVDLAQAEAFAVTFCKLAGRPLPGAKQEEPPAAEAPVEESAASAPEAAGPVPAEPQDEAPAFAGSDAFAAPEADETPAFAGSDAFAAPDDDEPEGKAFV